VSKPSRYCSLDDVQAKTGFKYQGDTIPNTGDALAIVQFVSATIDGALKAAGYTLPIPDEAVMSLTLLRGMSSNGAACQCWRAMFKGQDEPPQIAGFCETYSQFLESLQDNTIRLPDYDPLSGKMDAVIEML